MDSKIGECGVELGTVDRGKSIIGCMRKVSIFKNKEEKQKNKSRKGTPEKKIQQITWEPKQKFNYEPLI